MSLFSKLRGNKLKNKSAMEISSDTLYNYDDKVNREQTVAYLTMYADGQRGEQVNIWRMCDNYYNNKHDAQLELADYCAKKNIPWTPAIIPDPFIHVESQINTDIPEIEFSGRDGTDEQKAKTRQYVCQYVLDNNDLDMKNNRNQRRLGKLGNQVWKIGYDYDVELPGNIHGDIFVDDIDPMNIIQDPVAVDVDDAEYLAYIYSMHRIKAARKFRKQIEKLGTTIQEIGTGRPVTTELFSTESYEKDHDTVQVTEFWFRQPTAGKSEYEIEITDSITGKPRTIKQTVEWDAGDIACSIQINNTEIKYIPCYWVKTHKQNKMYPYALGVKIPQENKFWGKSEIESIKELVDAADRELALNILNDTFTANDIIIVDEASMADGSELSNEPGAIWYTKAGMDKPQRLGGLSGLKVGLKDTITYIREIIKQTIGNFDVNMGDAPPGNVKTLGGLVQLKEQGSTRQKKKEVGTTAMWQRIVRLIDFTAIEFYDDNRLIYLGAIGEQKPQMINPNNMDRNQGPVIFRYNSDNMLQMDEQGNTYVPMVDYKIIVGDGITNSPAMTIEATENIAGMNITPQNKEIVKGLTDLMKLPNRQTIKDSIDEFFANQKPPEDKPSISISFKDMPQDAQLQLLQQIGIQSQGGLSNQQQIEVAKTQDSVHIDNILKGLDETELKHLHENPELLQGFLEQNKNVGGY